MPRLSSISLRHDQILSRKEMKSIIGGQDDRVAPPVDDLDPADDGGGTSRCLGCNDAQECKRVNKGDSCDYCATHKKKCCSGWHTH